MRVHIVFGDREIEIRLRNRDATLADLIRAVTGRPAPAVATVDGRAVDTSVAALDSGLHEAAVLRTEPPEGLEHPFTSGIEAVVVGGLDAGRSVPLPYGRTVVGRDLNGAGLVLPHDTVSRRHAELSVSPAGVTVTDLGSANGVEVTGERVPGGGSAEVGQDDVVAVGALALGVRPAGTGDRPQSLSLTRHLGPDGAVSFNRPPRPARRPAPAEVTAPEEPGEPVEPTFSIAATAGPLVLAVIMVAMTRDLRFGLFALLSPLIGIGTYLESRRRNRIETKRNTATFERELDEFAAELAEAGAVERARRRDLLPDLAEVLRRAALPSTRLWERRPAHEDFLALQAGLAAQAWTPPVRYATGSRPDRVVATEDAARMPAAPVRVDLGGGGVAGIVGDRAAALAVARGLLCQAAVHHGPADLTVVVCADPGREPDWDWVKWLPHTRRPDADGRWLSARRDGSDALLTEIARGAATGTALVVLDSDVLTGGARSPARDLLNAARPDRPALFGAAVNAPPVAAIVIAATVDRLPAACDTVIEVTHPDGDGVVRRPGDGEAVDDVLLSGVSVENARACARDLARFEDPEVRRAGAGLPDGVRLLPLLNLPRVDGDSIRERWRRRGPTGVTAPLGVTETGVFTLDLVHDGPHGLIGGTTGSGKSELLRSLVAALAAGAGPDALTFVLMDYKGGAAFDECARLPHTVGLVTDLDEQLGERALRALEAELRRRERQLRTVGADTIDEYARSTPAEAMPRLVVVIDEFATLAKDLPDFLAALVGVAQRGRTLGVHLILATQRPSGAVNDNIRTNTNLRIALRVQDSADSSDVIGIRDAAELNRRLPGRAYVRLGPGEVVPIQTALVTCVTDATEDAPVEVTPFVFGGADESPVEHAPGGRSDLARLVDAIADAYAASGLPPPRRPWPEPLGPHLDLTALPIEPGRAIIAVADDPARQEQYPIGWHPPSGNLLLLGITGSGLTTTLRSIALSLAAGSTPAELEIYAIDHGSGGLGVLDRLPHTGAVIAADDRERQVRLIRHLRAELDRRRAALGNAATPGRRILVLIDNVAAMRAEFDDVDGLTLMDTLTRVYADGTAAGIAFAVSADRFTAIPAAWAAVTTQRWLFRLADRYDYSQAGLTAKDVPAAVPGRMVVTPGALQAQVGAPGPEAVAAAAARHHGTATYASTIGVLPAAVTVAALPVSAHVETEPWRLPLGIRESDLGVGELVLYEGEHALIAGPARCGKSTALRTLAAVLSGALSGPASGAVAGPAGGAVGASRPGVRLAAMGGRRSPLREVPGLHFIDNGTVPPEFLTGTGPAVLLIDDAETLDDAGGSIAGLLAAHRPGVHVIAAGRADALRSSYGHWTQAVRRSRTGLLLRPNIDLDGDLLGVTLPRRAPVRLGVGRGYLVHNGEWDIIQVATP